jgi:hypothetical protein
MGQPCCCCYRLFAGLVSGGGVSFKGERHVSRLLSGLKINNADTNYYLLLISSF